jgi:serine/threonine protein kinase
VQLGRCTLNELIGEGGFGQVWKGAITGEMGFSNPVAVKVLHPGLEIDDSKHASLIHEALLGARMKHPNIVDVYEITKVNGRFLMVMELVDGQTLDTIIKEHPEGMPVETGSGHRPSDR